MDPDTTALLEPPEITCIQQITGAILFYGRACYPTILVAINTITAAQSKGNKETAESVVQLLN
jgi:hypothetical protein